MAGTGEAGSLPLPFHCHPATGDYCYSNLEFSPLVTLDLFFQGHFQEVEGAVIAEMRAVSVETRS